MVAWMGPLATINREPGQTWKGAAAAVDLCAGVWLVQAATLTRFSRLFARILTNIFCFCCYSEQ
jgi:hypothetical protein